MSLQQYKNAIAAWLNLVRAELRLQGHWLEAQMIAISHCAIDLADACGDAETLAQMINRLEQWRSKYLEIDRPYPFTDGQARHAVRSAVRWFDDILD